MKKEIRITSLNEFEKFLRDLQNQDEWIFRGQKDGPLESTLYRRCGKKIFKEYLIDAKELIEKINLNFSKNLKIMATDINDSSGYIPCYVLGKINVNAEALIYLRHHGYLSPLLDWTGNPYIAAYFAFRKKLESDENVTIYCYKEPINDDNHYADKVRAGWTGESHIIYFNPIGSFNVERHIAQKALYTCAIAKDENDCVFCSHQDILNKYNEKKILGEWGTTKNYYYLHLCVNTFLKN